MMYLYPEHLYEITRLKNNKPEDSNQYISGVSGSTQGPLSPLDAEYGL